MQADPINIQRNLELANLNTAPYSLSYWIRTHQLQKMVSRSALMELATVAMQNLWKHNVMLLEFGVNDLRNNVTAQGGFHMS